MRDELLNLIDKYLEIFPEEVERQRQLQEYLMSQTDASIVDWNNFSGHIVAGGFIFAKKEKKFLVLYHKDIKSYLYPGGHVDASDINVLEAAKREIKEETGIDNLQQFILGNNEMIPFDIDTHMIGYNERLDLPEHYHFDFRFMFIVENMEDINIDLDEHSNYNWVDVLELANNFNYASVVKKINAVFLDKE